MTPEPSTPLLRIDELSVSLDNGTGSLEILRDINIDLGAGEFGVVIGPSGCGKTTLFNVLVGLNAARSGSFFLNGRKVSHIRGQVAYMQQKDLLLPWRSALDNAIIGMEIKGVPKKQARDEARKLLRIFGLEGFENHLPGQLSGGMRQRVALLRTILCRKDIWLMDEPFGALDAITRGEMQKWLLKVWSRFQATVLLVTHDVEEALILADKIYVMTARPAAIRTAIQVPDPRPRNTDRPEMIALKKNILDQLAGEIPDPIP